MGAEATGAGGPYPEGGLPAEGAWCRIRVRVTNTRLDGPHVRLLDDVVYGDDGLGRRPSRPAMEAEFSQLAQEIPPGAQVDAELFVDLSTGARPSWYERVWEGPDGPRHRFLRLPDGLLPVGGTDQGITSGEVTVSVRSFGCGPRYTPGQTTPEGQRCRATLRLSNRGEALRPRAGAMFLVERDGTVHRAVGASSAFHPALVGHLEIPVGKDVDAKLAFDLPDGAQPLLVRLSADPDQQPILVWLPGAATGAGG